MPLEGPLSSESCDVAIIGAGPAGLAMAAELKRRGVGKVVVLERDAAAGGVPRHCGHYPFGMREFRRLLRGPDYARRHVARAEACGADIRVGVTVAAIHPNGRLSLSSYNGLSEIRADRVAICTGVRESSRAQRFVGGPRQRGVVTTGALQAFVYLERLKPFHRPVIVGTELVSFSALLTCRHAGIRPVAMLEENDRVTARSFSRALPAILGVPIIFGARLCRILGHNRVKAVEVADGSGALSQIEADGVVFTGSFRPELALLRSGHLAVDPATGGPVIDQYGRASDPAYFCAGNLLRPVETSGWSAKEGRETACRIVDDLARNPAAPASVPVETDHEAIRYVVPQRLAVCDAPGAMSHLQLRLTRPVRGTLLAQADGRTLWSGSIDSRPERRVLAPLAPLLAYRGTSSISLTLKEPRK